MCAEKSDFFNCPAYKLMLTDIKSAVIRNHSSLARTSNINNAVAGEEADCEWSLKITSIPTNVKGQVLTLPAIDNSKESGLQLTLKLIWVQGTVLEKRRNEDNENYSVIISDDGGATEAQIHDYNVVPGGDHLDIITGCYIGALCQIWSAAPHIVLKPFKIMYLGEKAMHKTMWADEVKMNKAYLAGLLLPSL